MRLVPVFIKKAVNLAKIFDFNMTHVVITGGTRGIGEGLVEEFVLRGCHVTYSGTSDRSVTSSSEIFSEKLKPGMFKGVVCDVRKPSEIETLWDLQLRFR